ncbi:MAG: RHS repeat-associated core domain-containing protein, partial [Nitrosomonadaceae bacterium]
SRRILLTLCNDANEAYEYELSNSLTNLTNDISDTNSLTFDYTYDKVGNRLTMTVDGNEHSYIYDKLYQLKEANYPGIDITSYSYDVLGNRITVVVNGVTIDFDRNRLNQYISVDGNNYSYDDNGNLTDDGTYLYYYDCENRLTDVNDKTTGNPVASYTYDYLGRRVSKTVDGNTIKYCYDGDQVIAEYDGNDTLLRKFVYGPGIDEPVCMIVVNGETETRYYYHFDGLGSVVALSNANATIVEKYEYKVFGAVTMYDINDVEVSESSVNNPYFFTGRRLDEESDLYYYRARYYSPEIGRFLQTDPVGYETGMNLYTYVNNNPINWVDPHGLSRFPWGDEWSLEECGDYCSKRAAGSVPDKCTSVPALDTCYINCANADNDMDIDIMPPPDWNPYPSGIADWSPLVPVVIFIVLLTLKSLWWVERRYSLRARLK